MTKFKRFMESVPLAFLVAVLVVLLLVIAGILIFINVLGFTADNPARLWTAIATDGLFLVFVIAFIYNKRRSKKCGLPRDTEPEFVGSRQ